MGFGQLRTWTIFHICLFISFLLSSFIINIIQAGLYFTVGLLSKTLYRNINSFLVWQIHAQLLFVGGWWSDSFCRMHCTKETVDDIKGKKAIFLLNHHYELDWLFSWMCADAYGVLGNGRVMAKKMLQYVPTIGWAWGMSDFIFLARNWEKDKQTLTNGMAALASYPSSIWLLLFAEGTRLSPEKLELSQKFAQERNLHVLKHHLTPRSKGFVHVIQNMDTSKIPYVYDATLGIHPTEGGEATLTNILMGKRTVGDIYLRRYKTCDIPKDEEGATNFLMDVYKEKDELLGRYKETDGQEFTDQKVEVIKVPRKIGVLINTIFWNLMICTPILCKLGLMILSGNSTQMAIAVIIILTLYLVMKKFIDLTKINKGSHYGEKKKN